MPTGNCSTCPTCKGITLEGSICQTCFGLGVSPITGERKILAQVIATQVDIMDKLVDIKEKIDDIMDKLNEP